jgi:hypothetical protein
MCCFLFFSRLKVRGNGELSEQALSGQALSGHSQRGRERRR